MCIACEMGFWDMLDALPSEVRERILREQEAAARRVENFACDVPEATALVAAAPTAIASPTPDERKP